MLYHLNHAKDAFGNSQAAILGIDIICTSQDVHIAVKGPYKRSVLFMSSLMSIPSENKDEDRTCSLTGVLPY